LGLGSWIYFFVITLDISCKLSKLSKIDKTLKEMLEIQKGIEK